MKLIHHAIHLVAFLVCLFVVVALSPVCILGAFCFNVYLITPRELRLFPAIPTFLLLPFIFISSHFYFKMALIVEEWRQ